jgi:hypothetical protein
MEYNMPKLIRDGKIGPRVMPLIDSIPYLKEWISDHLNGSKPEAWLLNVVPLLVRN